MIPHQREIARELRAGRWERQADGILLPRMHALLQGIATIRGRSEVNLLTNEGLALIAADTFPATLYMALYGSNVTPVATWTGATFLGTAGEITSTVDGHVEATRPVCVLSLASPSEFNIRMSSGQLSVYGFGVLDSPTRGDTTNALIGARRFASPPELYDDRDIADIGYIITPTPV